jgi:hypothetical protein
MHMHAETTHIKGTNARAHTCTHTTNIHFLRQTETVDDTKNIKHTPNKENSRKNLKEKGKITEIDKFRLWWWGRGAEKKTYAGAIRLFGAQIKQRGRSAPCEEAAVEDCVVAAPAPSKRPLH